MFGDRLKLARKKEGYSLQGLSEALGGEVSAQAIGKYERGEMMPDSGVLMCLCKILKVSMVFLANEQVERLEEVGLRKLSSVGAREQARIEVAVIDSLQRHLVVELLMGIDSAKWKAPLRKSRVLNAVEDGEQLAKDVRGAWKLGDAAIPDMTALLEGQGIKVLVLPLPQKISGLTIGVQRTGPKKDVSVIVVNKGATLECRRLALARELGYMLVDPKSNVDREKAVDVFAAAFLIPAAHLIGEVGKRRRLLHYREIVQLKHAYRVSAVALLIRLRQLQIISESWMARVLRTFGNKWRTEEPEPLESAWQEGRHELPERFERLCYRALAEDMISLVKISELLRQSRDEIVQGMRGPEEVNVDRKLHVVNG